MIKKKKKRIWRGCRAAKFWSRTPLAIVVWFPSGTMPLGCRARQHCFFYSSLSVESFCGCQIFLILFFFLCGPSPRKQRTVFRTAKNMENSHLPDLEQPTLPAQPRTARNAWSKAPQMPMAPVANTTLHRCTWRIARRLGALCGGMSRTRHSDSWVVPNDDVSEPKGL